MASPGVGVSERRAEKPTNSLGLFDRRHNRRFARSVRRRNFRNDTGRGRRGVFDRRGADRRGTG